MIVKNGRQVAEIVYRYDAECVPLSYKNNMVAYIKDSSSPKLCSATLKVCLFSVLGTLIFRISFDHRSIQYIFCASTLDIEDTS